MNIAAVREAAPEEPATRGLSLVTEVTSAPVAPDAAAVFAAPAQGVASDSSAPAVSAATGAGAGADSSGAPAKRAYPPPAEVTTQESGRWLKHADFFFIGLSSRLSWLAWAVGTPVALVSGFTHPTNEFATPYRVINYHACNRCWNDPAHRFDHKDFLWCPRHKDTPRQFECTPLITVDHVKAVIKSVPGFGQREVSAAAVAAPARAPQRKQAAAADKTERKRA